MSRYIEAETLKVSILRYAEKLLSRKRLPITKKVAEEVISDVCFAIEVQDSADVVPVVRCKDCPLSKTDPNDYEDVYWCDFTPGRAHHSMDYCSEGARQKQMRLRNEQTKR